MSLIIFFIFFIFPFSFIYILVLTNISTSNEFLFNLRSLLKKIPSNLRPFCCFNFILFMKKKVFVCFS